MKKITVCLLEGIGNTVMTIPLVEALKQLGYKVQFLINPRGKNLTGMIGNHKYEVGTKCKGLAAVATLWSRCDNPQVSKNQMSAKRLDPFQYHESEMNMTIARKLGYVGNTPMPVMYDTKPTENDTVVIAVGCKLGKQWKKKKYKNWEELCIKLSKEHKLSFLGIREESEEWMNKIGNNLCGKLSLKDSINWIAGSKGVVAIDNGLAHISGALGLPTNVIFGPTLTSKNRQIGKKVNIITKDIGCRPCQLTNKWNNCKEFSCMDIPVKVLLNKIVL